MVGGHSWWVGSGGGRGGGTSGKSAVQLLQESKSQYVKSDLVLGKSQKPARPDRFHISSNPNIFLNAPAHTLHASRLSPDPPRKSPATEENVTTSAAAPTIATLTPSALAQHTNAISNKCSGIVPLPLRIQRGTPRPRAKTQPVGDPFNRSGDLRRSLSHGPADKGDDVQMKLRKLLAVGSKEKLYPESPTKKSVPDLLATGEVSTGTGTFRAEPVKVTVHKSLPDLFKTSSSVGKEISPEDEKRRPSCPSALSTEKESKKKILPQPPKPASRSPPPVPPRKSKETPRPLPTPPKTAPEVPKRNIVKQSPPRLPPRKVSTTSEVVHIFAHPPAVEICRRNSDSDASAAGGSEDMRRRPILRSKSDVTHERCLLGQKDDEESGSRTSLNKEDLENFFESMGLDRTTYHEIMSPENETSPLYFDVGSSDDSIPRRCSSDEDGQQPQEASMRSGEPSIVEKNARIIKWLFTCQRAQKCLGERTSTQSS